ncbi:MAG TPA: response regulator, partial [Candidatus Glassbacteria bacterium]|nr:response regulator [Candidatus Glassbacteria bacterium]
MPDSKGSLLVIDDEPEIRESLDTLLSSEGYTVELAPSAEAGLQRLGKRPFDLVLLDVMLPDRSGLEVLREIRAANPALFVVMITAYGSVEDAVEAMRLGATNYITKPWDNSRLLAEIATLVRQERLTEENLALRQTLKQRYSFSQIIGKSDAMQKVLNLVMQVAPTRA